MLIYFVIHELVLVPLASIIKGGGSVMAGVAFAVPLFLTLGSDIPIVTIPTHLLSLKKRSLHRDKHCH